jgi:hypothetical protein
MQDVSKKLSKTYRGRLVRIKLSKPWQSERRSFKQTLTVEIKKDVHASETYKARSVRQLTIGLQKRRRELLRYKNLL